ncbi:MAG: ribose 5-phosphate isomerase B [Bacteroidia bacterium]|jgi:ribose 5-phosphate isomerase B|nr:ribose 5-phosphate isomerase B [Bacteroidia bacterium]
MSYKKLAAGSDHAGFALKQEMVAYLRSLGYEVTDHGTHTEQSVDYPDFAHPVASAVEKGEAELGLLICGSGNGISMAANKHAGIRAALCWKPEIAELARQHNDANIISLPARFISTDEAKACIDKFLNTAFEGGRHANRVNKIPC